MGTIGTALELHDLLYANIGGVDGTDRSWATSLLRQTLRTTVTADLSATVGATLVLGRPTVPTTPFGGSTVTTTFRVIGARLNSGGTLTADSTNYGVVTINSYPQAGTTATAVSVITTNTAGTGSLVVAQSVDMTITAANAQLAAGGTLAVVISGAAGSVTIKAGTVIEVDVIPTT